MSKSRKEAFGSMVRTGTLGVLFCMFLAGCGKAEQPPTNEPVIFQGEMLVRSERTVETGTSCSSEETRDLRITDSDGQILARPELSAGEWYVDPTIPLVQYCKLTFTAEVSHRSKYEVVEGDSESIAVPVDKLGELYRFFSPAQFYNSDSYAQRPTTTL
jgi:hypothetical protein